MSAVPSYAGTGGKESTMPALETIKQRIRERLAATGMSANEASRRAGLGLSYVNDLLSGKSKNPVTTRLALLADVLGCDLGYLQGTQEALRAHVAVEPLQANGHGGRGETDSAARALPLYTANLTDPDGFFTMVDEEAVRFVPAAVVELDPQAYAVSVADGANAPRYLPGEVVVVSTRKPVAPRSFAVIRMQDDRAIIRKVIGITSTGIEVEAIEDLSRRTIPRAEIKTIHRIVASFEG